MRILIIFLLCINLCINPCFAANPIPKGVGITVHFTGAPAKDIDLIEDAGFNIVRTDLKWDRVETVKGQYNWEEYDLLVESLLAREIIPYLILDYNNTLYGAVNAMDGITTPEQVKGFTNFAKAAAEHYKGKKIIFEIWNEPNLDIFWKTGPDPTEYMDLVKSASPAMKKVDPDCIIVGPGVAFIKNTFDYLQECIQQGLLGYIDGLSIHPYKNDAPENGTIDYLYRTLRTMLKDAGKPDFPILAGEFGFSTTWSNVENEQTQAEFLTRQLIMHDYYNIPVSVVYDFRNDGVDPNNVEHNFGLLRNDYSPKPAYAAIKSFIENFSGTPFLKRIKTPDNSIYLYEYTGKNGKTIAGWTTSNTKLYKIYEKNITLDTMPIYITE